MVTDLQIICLEVARGSERGRLLQVFRLWGARAQSLMEGGKTPRGGVGGYLRTP